MGLDEEGALKEIPGDETPDGLPGTWAEMCARGVRFETDQPDYRAFLAKRASGALDHCFWFDAQYWAEVVFARECELTVGSKGEREAFEENLLGMLAERPLWERSYMILALVYLRRRQGRCGSVPIFRDCDGCLTMLF